MIHVIVCGYQPERLERCIASINMQSLTDRIIYTSIDKDDNRKYLVRNTWELVQTIPASDNDILVFVDADDFLCDEDALQIVAETYLRNSECLLTYGSYVNLSSNKRGKFCGPYGSGENVRTAEWRGSHLKTCKYKLWKNLEKSDLTWPDGTWFRCCADRAIMVPLMELAGLERCRYIDKLIYCYDDTNPISVWKTMRDESIKTRERIANMGCYARVFIK